MFAIVESQLDQVSSQVNWCILIYTTVDLIILIRDAAALIKASLEKKIVHLLLSLIFCENKKDLKVSSFNEPIDFLFKKNINELANISDVF